MRRWKLRTSLILLLVATTLTTFFLGGIGTLIFRLPQISAASQENATREAHAVASILENYLGGVVSRLRPATHFVRSGLPAEDIQRHLDAIVGDDRIIDALYVVDADGYVEAVGLPPERQDMRSTLPIGDFSANRLFRAARTAGKPTWSDKYLSALSGGIAIGIAIPAGKHTIIGEIASRAVVDTLHLIRQRETHPVLIIDSRGEWIADNLPDTEPRLSNWAGHPAAKAALAGMPPPESTPLGGIRQHIGYARSPNLGWIFLAGVPAGMNNPIFSSTVFLVLGTCLVSLVLGLLFAIFYATQMTRPLSSLLARTHQLAQGEFDATRVESNIAELDILARDMEQMAHAIQERQAEIAHSTKRLEDSEQELLAIFNASPVAMSISDVHRGYAAVNINEAWQKQFGYSREDVLGRNGAEIGLWAELADRQDFLARLEETGAVDDSDYWLLRHDGSRLICKTAGRIVNIGEQRFLIMVAEDITERRRNEEEIRALNSELEDRVQRRTEALQRANQELENTLDHLTMTRDELVRSEKLAALGRLVAGVAHELNTPIGNGVMAATTFRDQLQEFRATLAGGLKRSVFDNFLADADTASDIILRNLERGAGLINSFKRLAVDQTSSQRRVFVLAETIAEVLTILHPTLKRTPYLIETAIPGDIQLEGEPGALEQVFVNLINNALLHGFDNRDHGRIRINAERVDDARIHITFSDDGKGMDKEARMHVFEPFFTTRFGQGGSGLGLHIVHNAITVIFGGSIQCDSSPESGTRFDIVLPVVAPQS